MKTFILGKILLGLFASLSANHMLFLAAVHVHKFYDSMQIAKIYSIHTHACAWLKCNITDQLQTESGTMKLNTCMHVNKFEEKHTGCYSIPIKKT